MAQNNSDGTLSIGTAIDLTGFDEGVEQMIEHVNQAGDTIEQQSARIQSLLTDVPALHIDMSTVINDFDSAFAEIDRIVDTNESAIKELEAEWKRLAEQQKVALNTGDDKQAKQLYDQAKAIRENVKLRKEVVSEAKKQADALLKLEQQHKADAEASKQDNEQKKTLKQTIRELQEAMQQYVLAGGSEKSEEYRAMAEELGRLRDVRGDIQQQGSVFANDENQIAGVIQGLSGLSGAFSAAQGVVALFGGENEHLQQIMLRVQALMSITMGLQQLQQALNKDSTFQLVTMNKLKEVWNKLMGDGNKAEEAAVATKEADVAVTEQQATMTAAETAAEEANTAATEMGATADKSAAAAKELSAASSGKLSIAEYATAAATKAASLAMKGFKLALISTGIGAIIWALGEVISLFVEWVGSSEEATQAQKAQEQATEDGAKAYAKAYANVQLYTDRLNNFNGTKKQEEQLVKACNDQFGKEMGYCKSVDEWKQRLTQKSADYCTALRLEAEAQAILNAYTEAYLLVVKARNKAASEYGNWFTTKAGDEERKAKAVASAQAEADELMNQYLAKAKEAQALRDKADIGGHKDPSTGGGGGGRSRRGGSRGSGGGGGSTFDPKAAARAERKAIEEWVEAVAEMRKDAYDKLADLDVQHESDATTREINQISLDTKRKITAWEEQLRSLAKEYIKSQHDIFMSKKGANENKWEDYAKQNGLDDVDKVIAMLTDANGKFADVAKYYNSVRTAITEDGNRREREARQKHYDQLVEDYGNFEQKFAAILLQNAEAVKFLPAEFQAQADKMFNQQTSDLVSERIKHLLNWEELFNGMDNASTASIELMIQNTQSKLKSYGSWLTDEQRKEFTDAITKMQDEIASRNPFTQMHKSLTDLKKAQQEVTKATEEYRDAQSGVHGWLGLYNSALEYQRTLEQEIAEGKRSENDEQYIQQQAKVTEMLNGLNAAREKETNAFTKLINAQNKASQSYKNFATGLKNAGSLMGSVGEQAQKLAACFSDDIADSIGIALDTMDEIIEAADVAINAISELGKKAAKGVETAVDATSQGMKASGQAGAKAMSTMEKASAILAVISAAMQVASAIINLFNNDSKHEKEIEALQRRIDQLQWELDNANTVRLQNNLGDALERVRITYASIYNELLRLHAQEIKSGNFFTRIAITQQMQTDAWRRSVEKLADAYAGAAYTADKALGSERYTSARKQLENLAEQQTLVYRQMQEEEAKKKTDHSKVDDYKRQIAELAQEMADIVNDALEEIIGNTAADLASELGDAFFDACASGEDALEAWHTKAKDVVRDITKRMLISKFLEEPLGKIFDKYKTRWFGDDGRFRGIDNVINSMNDFSADIDAVGDSFNDIFNQLPDQMKEMFTDTAERSGTQGGITTASQDSVDELNARITTIQGHTYTIMNAVVEMNATSNAVLDRLTGIERNTGDASSQLATMQQRMRNIESAIDDINTKGLKVR